MMRACLWILLGVGLGACTRAAEGTDDPSRLAAEPFGAAECAACGMVVREQPAPRAQLIHRDGTRAHFCSVGDMLTYHDAPSPHGKPVRTFVEVSEPGAGAALSAAPLPWQPAESAKYVLGVPRAGVMGLPTLAYADEPAARSAAQTLGGSVADWASVRAAAAARLEKK